MSTRSTTHFVDHQNEAPEAIIYRHNDGYPDGHGKDLLAFFLEVAETVPDTRFGSPSYLAAKLVVWLAKQFAVKYDFVTDPETGKSSYDSVPTGYLDFISVGVVQEDPGDIEYRYIVDCGTMVNGRPKVTVQYPDGSAIDADDSPDVVAELAGQAPVLA